MSPDEVPSLLVAGLGAAVSGSEVTVSDLQVSTGRSYQAVTGGLAVGASRVIDRASAFASPLISPLVGRTFVRAADADALAAPGSSSFLRFDVDRDVRVVVAHDNRLARPEWLLNGWVDTGFDLNATQIGGTRMRMFAREFPRGTVVLGSNVRNTSIQGAMYTVILVSNGPAAPPAPPAPPPPPAPPGGGWNPHSPHMPSGNLKFAITAWQSYVTPGSAEADFVAGHFDAIMAGPLPYLHQRNPTATIMPYALMWTVPPAGYSSPDLGSVYEWDMVQWYQQNPQCNIETAYLHVREPRTPANRHLTPIVPDNPWHNQHRYAQMNPTDPCFLRYTVDRFQRIAQSAYVTGMFVDIHDIHTLSWMDGSVEHSSESLRAGIVSAWTQIRQQVNVPFFLNTATYDLGWTPDRWITRAAAAAGGAHMENFLSVRRGEELWAFMDDLQARGGMAKATTHMHRGSWPNVYREFGNHSDAFGRGEMFLLSSIYMASKPGQTYYGSSVHESHITSWYAPRYRDLGRPVAPRALIHNANDPTGQRAAIYAREFERAYVVNRPANWDRTNFANATRVTVPLPAGAAWYRVLDDNTLAATPSTSVRLAGAEGAIFVRGQ